MQLRFLGKESKPNESPTLFATDRDSYVVQGWIVSDPDILATVDLADDETVVEVPARLMTHLAKDGLEGEVASIAPPIVHITQDGNYVIRGSRVTDRNALGQMNIPDHETCIEVTKARIVSLLAGG